MQRPEQIYQRRRQAYRRLRERQVKASNRLSNYRSVVFLFGLVAAYLLYRVSPLGGLALGVSAFGFFAYLAILHQTVRTSLRYAEIFSELNGEGLQRMAGEWTSFRHAGREFGETDHAYAADLDLFGQASLFQWVSSAETPLGQEQLAKLLKYPTDSAEEIRARQEAVLELAPNLAWRQRLQAEGRSVADKLAPALPLLQWAKQTKQEVGPVMRLVTQVLPLVTLSTLALYLFAAIVPWQIPTLLASLQLLLLWVNNQQRSRAVSLVYRHEAGLRTYAKMLQQIEELQTLCLWLRARQDGLRDARGRTASGQIRELSAIAERIANRANVLFFVVNVLTLWDYRCLIALDRWKRKSGRLLATWLQALAEIEAISSLANIRFEHPDWAMPEIVTDGQSGLTARQMGHPLLTKDSVKNDFRLESPVRISLITGSNMSGKSTFLRTIGCNLVLAYAGAPVCAEQFSCTLMHFWTCMRVNDDLEQNISSFYAELLRIKRIVQAARAEPPVCFLLDEIFKGTNSHDRHLGAKALIRQLLRDGACGLVSTHDLELGELESASGGRVINYHFREYYQGPEIRFDYKLRRGVSTTRNALYLIKLAGIELDDEREQL